jgi:hypothetical protein
LAATVATEEGRTLTGERDRLATELEFYELRKREWLAQHAGQYVVVRGRDVLGFFPEFVAAYSAGANAWGPDTDFLVKQVLEFEPTFSVF